MSEYRFKVKWGDTDAAGIVFYPNYYKWMDEATHEMFDQLGHPSHKLFTDEKVGFPILEAHCQFFAPSFFADPITVVSRVVEIKNKVFKVEHTFLSDGQTRAEGYEIRAWTIIEKEKPKAVPIPEEMRTKLEQA